MLVFALGFVCSWCLSVPSTWFNCSVSPDCGNKMGEVIQITYPTAELVDLEVLERKESTKHPRSAS